MAVVRESRITAPTKKENDRVKRKFFSIIKILRSIGVDRLVLQSGIGGNTKNRQCRSLFANAALC